MIINNVIVRKLINAFVAKWCSDNKAHLLDNDEKFGGDNNSHQEIKPSNDAPKGAFDNGTMPDDTNISEEGEENDN